MNKVVCLGVLSSLVFSAAEAVSEEGMWLPEQLPERAESLQEQGLELDPVALSDLSQAPLGAVISLGGCSASFVSATGLVVTNHHCAVRALQMNSTADDNVLEDGFYAETMSEELWAGAGSRVYVTEALTDVTERVLGTVPEGATDVERYEALDRAEKELVAECEATEGYRCNVVSYYGGGEYRLVRQLEIEDVRLVYAPPRSIGEYGGEEDNWMWPRHTGDWTFFRAYVNSDGEPAAHSEDNVPYAPAHHLTVSTAGVSEGDFVMVAGYPGRTQRYATADDMAYARDTRYPWSIGSMVDLLEILNAISETDEDAAVRLAPFRFGLMNYHKNNLGMLDGFERSGVAERAAETERGLQEWLEDDNEQHQQWRSDIAELGELSAESRGTEQRDRLLGWAMWGVDLLSTASRAHWLSVEREKPDLERDQGYQERDWPRIAEGLERMEASYVEEADRQLLVYFLNRAHTLPQEQRIEAFEALLGQFDGDAEAAVDHLYDTTELGDPAHRLNLLEATREDLESSDDPLVQLAVALYPLRYEMHVDSERRSGAFTRVRPSYVAALSAYRGGAVYPDANSTLRITYGQVRGYSPRDAVWHQPLTSVSGIVEKHTGESPFNAPQRLLDAAAEESFGPYRNDELGSVPVNFLSTLDTTGGNSGSVTLNARGELCGLLFDGNYESMASDWLFDTVSTRSIHVDAVYMLWVMDRVDGAHRILRELGIEPSFAEHAQLEDE